MALTLIDYLAVAVFAASGALAAVERRMDVIGVVWLAAVTGIGGGTMRDLLLGLPVFWVREPDFILIATAAAVLVYLTAGLPASSQRILLWLDAAGLAFVAVSGAAKALGAGAAPSIALVMGVITAALGGIIRDVLAHGLGLGELAAAGLGLGAGFGLRGGAIIFGWSLPNARARRSGDGQNTP